MSPNLSESVITTGLEPADKLSDHGSVLIEIGKRSKKQARGFWRFNNSLLTNWDFLDSNNSLIINIFKEYEVTDYSEQEVEF